MLFVCSALVLGGMGLGGVGFVCRGLVLSGMELGSVELVYGIWVLVCNLCSALVLGGSLVCNEELALKY